MTSSSNEPGSLAFRWLISVVACFGACGCTATSTLSETGGSSQGSDAISMSSSVTSVAVDTIEPSVVPNSGGTMVTLTGHGLGPGVEVRVSGTRLKKAWSPRPDLVVAEMVPAPAGPHSVSVVRGDLEATTTLTVYRAEIGGCSLLGPGVLSSARRGHRSGSIEARFDPGTGLKKAAAQTPGVWMEIGWRRFCCPPGLVCKGAASCANSAAPQWGDGWRWAAMKTHGCAECAKNESAWVGTFVPDEQGRYFVVARATRDFGVTFTYCDRPKPQASWGSDDGCTLDDAGQLEAR